MPLVRGGAAERGLLLCLGNSERGLDLERDEKPTWSNVQRERATSTSAPRAPTSINPSRKTRSGSYLAIAVSGLSAILILTTRWRYR